MGLDTRNPVLWCANNKGADQPVHLHSLISVFVIRFLESIKSKLASSKFSGDSHWFESRYVGNPKDRFCRNEANIILAKHQDHII